MADTAETDGAWLEVEIVNAETDYTLSLDEWIAALEKRAWKNERRNTAGICDGIVTERGAGADYNLEIK